ncbi:MAG TPA: methylated-DNA--[protein]-cysteine S-methyltransferase [Jatrophihabitantaceae bacterium]|jgi:methylated-DNA-[protein]-cysteine S-methyltransferase
MTRPTMNNVSERDVAGLLASAAADADILDRLHERLEEAAIRDGLLDVAYTRIDTPVGSLLLAATERGLVRVAYDRENHDTVLETLAARLSPRILHAPQRLEPAVRQIDEYFAGSRLQFDLPLDFALSHGFRQTVQRHLSHIAYGRTESYKQVAVQVGSPNAVRAVGTACATNPLPVVVPCHRVLRTDGTIGKYVGGPDAKTHLLHLESAAA